MTATKPRQSIQYSDKTVLRADRAMRCAPFRLRLFATMIQQSVSLGAIAHTTGVQNQYTVSPLSELRVESELLWLIQVGLLRREVDGQGLTDSFRVTPLGRSLVDKWQQHTGVKRYSPSISDRLYNAVLRWFRLPI
ncbi:Npun_F0494 family protein [Leptolyngbyaceae cyanobacterium UHCC 1019]